MKEYENIICKVLVFEDDDIVTTSAGMVGPGDGIMLPGEDLVTK